MCFATGTRKLKCSGEVPQCSRCEREGIRCIYSPQKQMGRPRKRRREEGPAEPLIATSNSLSVSPDKSGESTPGTFPGISVTSVPSFADYALLSSPGYNGFPEFAEFQHASAVDGSLGTSNGSNGLFPPLTQHIQTSGGAGSQQQDDFAQGPASQLE